MLKFLRLATVILLIMLFVIPAGCVGLVLLRAPGARTRALARMTMAGSRVILFVLGFRIKTVGEPPKATGLLVSNHTSYMDVLVLYSVRPTVFIAKKEVKGWPFIGLIAALCGTVFIKRESKRSSVDSLAEVERVLGYGVEVVVFPEGTTSDGSSVHNFSSLFFESAVRANAPVVLATVAYRQEGGRSNVPWYADMPLFRHFLKMADSWKTQAFVRFNATLHPEDIIGNADERRKKLAATSRHIVADGLEALKADYALAFNDAHHLR
jgi:1-acyl-sn-glycerol-3-phosphate acyltransferase